jgi:hypothetical protein
MTTFKGYNGFGNSAGDSLSTNATKYGGRGALRKGKLNYSGELGNISGGNRRLAKAKYGAGSSGTSFRGQNAFSKGRKG